MDLIVISDLHLSVGCKEETERYSRNEDFFFDKEFKKFLQYLQNKNPGNNHLIIAGDLFDFLQVDEFLAEKISKEYNTTINITPQELRYGLGTEVEKTCCKLHVIAKGHKMFFQALADFLAKENELSILTGNHDIELYWEGVKNALINHIVSFEPNYVVKRQIANQISFYQWFYYDAIHQTYVEHGNQYDEFNSFPYLLHPIFDTDSKRLWLPFGSFFVRYFFNKLESRNPFADNIKPPTSYMKWAFRNNRLQFLKDIPYYLNLLFKVFRKSGKLSTAENNNSAEINDKKLEDLARETKLSSKAVKRIYALMAPPFTRNKLFIIINFSVTLFLISFIIFLFIAYVLYKFFGFSPMTLLFACGSLVFPVAKLVWSKFRSKVSIDDIPSKIKEQIQDVQIIVFGHTHDPDKDKKAKMYQYLNTGTWTTVFSEEERIIREAKQFGFVSVKLVNEKPEAELYQWNSILEEPQKLILFEKKA